MIPQKVKKTAEISILLHNIRSTHNVGSIFRTADGFGVANIYISGTTPAPVDRFGRERADVAKVALGAEKSVSWKQIDMVTDFIKTFKKNGGTVIILEQNEKSIDLHEYDHEFIRGKGKPTLLILGEEVHGVSDDIINLADVIVEIPMKGMKESFNVSVAAGIALYELA